MTRSQSKTIVLTVLALFLVGCSKAKREGDSTGQPATATSVKPPSPAAPAPTPKPPSAGTGPAVLKKVVTLPDGGNCTATVDHDCTECVQKKCAGTPAVDGCDSLKGKATAGPAAGTAKSTLCREALECIRRTKCHANSLIECYCGKDIDLGTCNMTTTEAKGACKDELERALEVRPGSPGSAAINLLTEASVAGGTAGIIATCENTACTNLCVPYEATSCL